MLPFYTNLNRSFLFFNWQYILLALEVEMTSRNVNEK